MTKYKCSECGLSVIVIPNEDPIKACKCEAPITAEIQASVTGNAFISIK